MSISDGFPPNLYYKQHKPWSGNRIQKSLSKSISDVQRICAEYFNLFLNVAIYSDIGHHD